jgi:hypothetical protein
MQTPIKSKINDEHNPVPENTILVVTEDPGFDHLVDKLIEPLAGKPKRDWFVKHAYFCLPLTVGNQYGFAIKSAYNFTAEWNGGATPADLKVTVDEPGSDQMIFSHFGMGVITIQNRFHFRTPLGINLITLNPPNMFIPHLQNLTGVVETDNLRRDFTFNLKVTTPGVKISVKAGDMIAAILPIPRFSVENYKIIQASAVMPQDVINNERSAGARFAVERSTVDIHKPNRNGRRYSKGVDIYDNPFYQHQKTVRPPT